MQNVEISAFCIDTLAQNVKHVHICLDFNAK